MITYWFFWYCSCSYSYCPETPSWYHFSQHWLSHQFGNAPPLHPRSLASSPAHIWHDLLLSSARTSGSRDFSSDPCVHWPFFAPALWSDSFASLPAWQLFWISTRPEASGATEQAGLLNWPNRQDGNPPDAELGLWWGRSCCSCTASIPSISGPGCNLSAHSRPASSFNIYLLLFVLFCRLMSHFRVYTLMITTKRQVSWPDIATSTQKHHQLFLLQPYSSPS